MTLDEFVAEMSQDVARFSSMWSTQQATAEAESFPLEMQPGDWFDQFLMFISSGDEQ